MSTSVNIGITAANGKKSTKAVTDIDPSAANSDIKAFTSALNNLTTNSITSINKIVKEDIDKTYTPITFTVDNNQDLTSIVPTKVDDFHYTIPNANLHAQGVYIYNKAGDASSSIYWGYTALKLSQQLPVKPYIVMSSKSEDQYIWIYADPITSVSNPYIELGILTDNDNTSGLVGVEFDVIVPAGQSGSTNWDSYTINFKVV